MLIVDLTHPPPITQEWVAGFVGNMRLWAPELSPLELLEHAVAAYRCAWLLDTDEAAELWFRAIRSAASAGRPR